MRDREARRNGGTTACPAPSPLSEASGRRAFTLIEAVAALVIVAVMVPPTLVMIRDAHTRRASPTLASRARWLASEKLEDIIADRHSTTRGYDYVSNVSYPAENPVAGFAAYSRTVSVVETGSDLVSAGSGYKRISVTVSWTDPVRGPSSLSLSTVVCNFTP